MAHTYNSQRPIGDEKYDALFEVSGATKTTYGFHIILFGATLTIVYKL